MKTLRLDSNRQNAVMLGLQLAMDHNESMAAINFMMMHSLDGYGPAHGYHSDHLRRHLDELHLCHEMRARLRRPRRTRRTQ